MSLELGQLWFFIKVLFTFESLSHTPSTTTKMTRYSSITWFINQFKEPAIKNIIQCKTCITVAFHEAFFSFFNCWKSLSVSDWFSVGILLCPTSLTHHSNPPRSHLYWKRWIYSNLKNSTWKILNNQLHLSNTMIMPLLPPLTEFL